MRLVLATAIAVCAAVMNIVRAGPAHSQAATLPVRPSDTVIPPDVIYPDAVACNVTAPDGIDYKIIFYKSQTVSFAHEPNNVAEYGTTFLRDLDKFDPSVQYKWHLQLGQPGNITRLTLPSGWKTENCAIGRAIAQLIANKQALKLFEPQTPER
jgi:hypothetical protein